MKGLLKNWKREKGKILFYAAVAFLPLLQFFIFYVYVNINSIIMAFCNDAGDLVWFSNFKEAFQLLFLDQVMAEIWGNTAIVLVLSLILGTGLALVFSFYIYKKYPFSGLFKIILFLPQIISSIILITLFKYFVIEGLPKLFPNAEFKDLLSPYIKDSYWIVLFYSLLMGFGTQVMMYVGAMNNISESIVEYGKIDGVTALQEFVHITIPMVYSTVTTMVIVNLSGILINQMGLYNFFAEYAEYPLRTVGYNFYVKTLQARRFNGEGYSLLATQGIIFTVITVPIVLSVRALMTKLGPNLEK